MQRPRPMPFSLALSRSLGVVITLATAAIGRQLLMEGKRLELENARVVGPAGPDFHSFFVTLGAYVVLVLVVPLLWATIAAWRRKLTAAVVLALICLLYIVPKLGPQITASHVTPTKAPVIPYGAVFGYAALLVAWAVTSIKAAIDLRPRPVDNDYNFTSGPPPLPTSRLDFQVIDDLPKDDD